MKNKGAFSGFIVFLILIIVSAVVICFAIKNKSSTEQTASYITNKGETVVKKQKMDYIATIYIEGQIGANSRSYNQKWLLTTIKSIKDDDKNHGLIVFVNTPGGSVYETDEVYLALKDYKATGKKVYVYMGSLAASGGYYLSCAADKIYANRNTLTGSIGVIAGQTFDITGLMEKTGIKSETIHAGKNKNMGNFNESLSDEQRAILQSVADECYEQFTGIVSADRKIPIDKVKQLADGRIYTAKQALDNKLIDKISSFDEAMEDFKKNELEGLEYPNVEFKVPQSNSLLNLMNYAKASMSDAQLSSKLGLPLNVAEKLNTQIKYPAYFYGN